MDACLLIGMATPYWPLSALLESSSNGVCYVVEGRIKVVVILLVSIVRQNGQGI